MLSLGEKELPVGLLKKVELFEAEKVGLIALVSVRLPFRVFFRKNRYQFLFKPNFSGAKWYNLDHLKVNAEELAKAEDAYEAMAYLRSIEGGFERLP